MNTTIINRRLRQIHLWLGLAIGAQVILWLVSGLFMTIFAIGDVRGDPKREELASIFISDERALITPKHALNAAGAPATSLMLQYINNAPVWLVNTVNGDVMVHGESGEIISPLPEDWAKNIAQTAYAGEGQLQGLTFYEEGPHEYGREGPVWQVQFGTEDKATFYVNATTGHVAAVRTLLWRTFDFMWGLHIMDWSTRENFNSWWIKMTASLAVIFAIVGVGIASLQVRRMLRARSS